MSTITFTQKATVINLPSATKLWRLLAISTLLIANLVFTPAIFAQPPTVKFDASTLALTNGNVVTSWGGQTSAGTPTYLTGQTPNGSPAVQFNGGGDRMGNNVSLPASAAGDWILVAVIKPQNIGAYHNLADDDPQVRPMLWIDHTFRYELNFGGGSGALLAGTGPNGWDIVIADSRLNQLYVNSPTPNALGGGAVPYPVTKFYDYFHRDGVQTFQGLVAEMRLYNNRSDFGGDFAALYNEMSLKWINSPCTAPTITCPGNQAANTASNSCNAIVNYSSSSTGTPAPAITYSFAGATSGSGAGNGSGSRFNKGTTTVTLTATNSCGTATCSFNVVVTDVTPPAFEDNTEIPLYSNNFENPINTVVGGDYQFAMDISVFQGVNYLYGPEFQQIFTVETILINGPLNVFTDPTLNGGNYSIGIQSTGQDDRLALTFNTQNKNFLNVKFDLSAIATRNIDFTFIYPNPNTTPVMRLRLYNSPGGIFNINAPGALLDQKDLTGIPPGATPFTFNWAEVIAGLNASGSTDGNVTLEFDLINPNAYASFDNLVITASNVSIENGCPDDIVVNNDPGLCTAVVNFSATAVDNCSAVTYTYSHASGSAFPIGTTPVTVTAVDASGNINTCTFNVTVTDPEINVKGNATSIVDGDNSPSTTDDTDFETTFPSTNVTKTYTIENTGTEALTVNTIGMTGAQASNYTVGGITLPATIAPGGSSTFTVTFQGTSVQVYNAEVVINNNDCNEAEYNYAVKTEISCVAASFSVCPTAISTNTDAGLCSAVVSYTATATGTPTPTITYVFTGATIANGNGTGSGSTFNKGVTNVVITASNGCGNNATCSFTVTVNDNELPTITCPSNIPLSACVSTASWTTPTIFDNCPGATVIQTAGPASGSTFANGTTTTITYTATDASNNSISCSFTVSRATALSASSSATAILCYGGTSTVTVTATDGIAPYTGTGTFTTSAGNYSYTVTDANGCTAITTGTIGQPTALVATCSNNNPSMYFGFTGDQSATIKAIATGGVAPYTVSITMNRALNCNVITSTGDELWAGVGGTNINNVCPASGSGLIPVSTGIVATSGGFYSVNVTLMQDATFTATITDANGCVTTCTTTVHGEDARCFAGNSGNAKITICHQTGSTNKPCVKICVDESAVAAHLAHGDFLGICTPTCVAPIYTRQANVAAPEAITPTGFNVKAFPNPTENQFSLVVESNSNEKINIVVYDALGRTVKKFERGNSQQPIYFGDNLKVGAYLVEVRQGENKKTIKLVKL